MQIAYSRNRFFQLNVYIPLSSNNHTTPSRVDRRSLLYVSIIIVSFFILYSLTRSRNLSIAHDSISYINAIDSRELFHPHHLLFNWFAVNWIRAWNILNPQLDSSILVELLNALFGSLTLGILFLLLRTRLFLKNGYAILGTLLPAFSFGLWFYSTTIEVYIIPLFFIVLTLYLMTSQNINARTYFFIGITHGLAILFHQIHILFIAAIICSMIQSNRNANISLVRSAKYYLLSIIPTVLIPYIAVATYVLKSRSIQNIYLWLTAYAHQSQFWHKLNPSTLLKGFIGFSRSIIGGHFIFAIPYMKKLMNALLKDKWLVDEVFLVRNMPANIASILGALSVILALILCIITAYHLRYWRSFYKENSPIVWILIVWLLSYSIFFVFWEPSNLEFWIPQSVCFWILITIIWNRPANRKHPIINKQIAGLSLIAGLLFVVNVTGSIRWLTDKNNDYYAMRTHVFQENTEQGDLAIIGRSWIMKDYLKRYIEADVLSLADVYSETNNITTSVKHIHELIEETLEGGHTVYISEDAVYLEKDTIRLYGRAISALADTLWQTYREKWIRIENEISPVYLLLNNTRTDME